MVLSRNNRDQIPVLRDAEGDIGVVAVTSVDPTTGLTSAGAISSNQVYYDGAVYTLQIVALDVATDPDAVVAAPGAGFKIVHVSSFVTNQGSANIDFTYEDDAGARTHTITAGANGGGGNVNVLFECSENDALNVAIASGTATDLGVTVNYIIAAV